MLLITSVVILLPILAGLIIWDNLPDKIAVHFDANNRPDTWSSKGFAVFGIPLFMLFFHWLAVAATEIDPRRKNISSKMIGVVLWICPSICPVISSVIYAYAMDISIDVGVICMLLIGVLFIAIGNYLPKCKPNHVVGIRTHLTLIDDGNWRMTHRVAGFTITAAGVIVLATAFLHLHLIFFLIILLSVLIPYVYSYIYYRRHR